MYMGGSRISHCRGRGWVGVNVRFRRFLAKSVCMKTKELGRIGGCGMVDGWGVGSPECPLDPPMLCLHKNKHWWIQGRRCWHHPTQWDPILSFSYTFPSKNYLCQRSAPPTNWSAPPTGNPWSEIDKHQIITGLLILQYYTKSHSFLATTSLYNF